jgi:DNA-binding winged helix-turn-helix (wHTH) protein
MHILRRALALPGRPDVIETVHGLGYRFVAERGH